MDDFKIRVGAELDKSAEKQIQDGLKKVAPKPIDVPFKINLNNSKEIENEMKRLVSKLTKGKGSLSDFKIDTSTIFDKDLGQRVEKLNGVTIKYKNELGEVVSELYKLNQIGSEIGKDGQEEAIMGWSKAISSYSQNIEQATKKQDAFAMKQKELIEDLKLLKIQADKSGVVLNQDNVKGFETALIKEDSEKATHYLRLLKKEYSQLNAMMEKDLPISGLENMKKNIGTMPIDIQNVETSFKRLQVQPDELRNRINQLSNSFKSLDTFKGSEQEKVKQYNLLKGEINGVTKEVKSLIAAQQQQISMDDKTKFKSSITSWSNDNTKGAKLFRAELKRIQRELSSADKTKFTALKKEFGSIQKQTEAMGKSGRTAFQEIGNNFKKFASWYGIAGVTTSAVRGVKQFVSTVIELDKSLVDLQQATGFTAEEAGKLLSTYIDLGQELGATGTEVASAADVWLRQGKSIAETNTLIRDSMILSKIGQIDSAQATQYLTSAMKGYKVEVSDVLGIIDKLSAVDLNSATSVGGLAEAMSRTSNGARIAGVEMDKLLGMLAVVGEVSQKSMDSVGESFKTIFARMGNIKLGKFVDEDGNDITTEINDVEKILNKVDIKLRSSATEFRDFGDVLDDVGKRWSVFNDLEQSAIASAFAGVRQRENIITLFENYGDSLKYTEISANSAGTAMDKFSAYEESVEAKTKTLKASLQELSVNTLDSNAVKGFLDLSNVLVNATDDVGLFNIALISLFGILAVKKGLFKSFVYEIGNIMIAQTGWTASTYAQAYAQVGLTGAIKATGVAIKTFMATNPVGWILGLTAVLGGAVLVYNELNDTLEENQEALSNLKGEYDSITTEVETLESQIESITKKMKDLEEIKPLTFTEDTEYQKLVEANDELQRTLNIQKEIQRIEGKKLEEQALKTIGQKSEISLDYEIIDGGYQGQHVVRDKVTRDKAIRERIEEYEELITTIDQLKDKQEELALAEKTETDEYKNISKELKSVTDTRDRYYDYILNTSQALETESKSLVGATDDGNKYKNVIEGLLSDVDNFITGINGSDTSLKDLNKTMDDTVTSSSDASEEIITLADALATFSKNSKLLETVKKEFEEIGEVSTDTLKDIANTYPELENIVQEYLLGIVDKDRLLSELEKFYQTDVDNYRDAIISKKSLDEGFYKDVISDLPNWVKDLAESYQLDFDNYKNLQEAKLDIYQQFAGEIAKVEDLLAHDTQESYENALIRTTKFVSPLSKIINELDAGLDSKLNLKGYTPSSLPKDKKDKSSSKTDPIKDAFDLGINGIEGKNDLDYKLAMEEYNQQQYLDGLEKINKATFGKHKDKYLEQYRQYVIEVDKGKKQIDEKALEDAKKLEEERYKNLFKGNDNQLSSISYDKQDILNAIDEIEAANGETTEQQYRNLIKLSDEEIKLYEQRKKIAETELASTKDAERISELTQEIQSCEDSISDAKVAQLGWNQAINQIPINKLEKLNEQLQDNLDNLSKRQEQYDKVISAVVSSLENEISYWEQKKDLINDEDLANSLANQIKSANDELDALQKQNDERQKALNLQKAQYDLERAKNQKTQRVYRENKGFVYESDTDAIMEAQQKIDELTYTALIDTKKETIQALEDTKNELIKQYDNEIEKLNEIKEQWGNISSLYDEKTNLQLAEQYLGNEWLEKILDGETKLIESFEKSYISLEKSISNLQSSIDANNKLINNEPSQSSSKSAIDRYASTPEGMKDIEKAAFEQKDGILSPAEFEEYLKRVGKSHDGLELGYIGEKSNSKDTFKMLALDKLKPDEIPRILQVDEAVLTKMQQNNILGNMLGSFQSGVKMGFQNITPRQQNAQPSFSIGEIHLHEVQNVDGLKRDIQTRLLPEMNQWLNR